jgi:molybdopterin biosynthesis enzyme
LSRLVTYATFLITVLAESEYTLAVKFDLESDKRVLAKTDLNSGSLFISRLTESECLLVIKSELESVLVESESELNCAIEAITLHIYI